jgi:magnesium-transporting ATPase (P-type)
MMEERPFDQYASLLPLEVCAELRTAPQGLTEAEARVRLARYGPNVISDDEGRSVVRRLVAPFTNWITLLLLLAGALAFLSGTAPIGWAIIVVALLNGLFTFWQEYLAERAIAALRHLLPETAYVRRDGQVRQVPTAEIVPGDVLPLKPDTVVVADGYLIAGEGLRVKQTMLTGNNAPVTKVAGPLPDPTLALTERPNLVLAGTQVIEGQGSLVVIGTGMRTLLGEIAQSTAGLRAEQSPLGKALNRLAASVSRVAIVAGIAAFLVTTLGHRLELRTGIIFAIGMIVAFVPEGLLPTVTLALALARRRLQRQRVLVKRLAGVEGLGAATVLCLDRASSLAANLLTVAAVWVSGRRYQVTGSDYTPEGAFLHQGALVDPSSDPDLLVLLRAAALCTNARLLPPDDEHAHWHILGDPTEGAMLVAAAKAGIDAASLATSVTRLQTLAYDPRRQMFSIVAATPGDGGRDPRAYVRGAAATLLPLCTHMIEEGAAFPLDQERRAAVARQIDDYARAGMRVLALAMRTLDPRRGIGNWRIQDVEHDLTLLGLIGVQEPPRPEVLQLVEGCRKAGLRLILATGAYGLTAEAGARRAGIIEAAQVRIVSGAELDELSDAALEQVLANGEVIFAQLGAAQKRRIVAALQARGEVVAFLGDSINDAPALKQADIGVAVSTSGTTVALAAADIVLDADHPAGLLLAIEEGRAIFSNIQKCLTYIFTHNVAETVVVVASVLLGVPLPLTVLQVLAIDLGTELFPAVALSTEPPEPGLLQQPPRARTASLIDRTVLLRAFAWLGLLEGVLALWAYLMGYWGAGWRPGQTLTPAGTIYAQATTLTYAAIVMAQIGNAIANRTRHVSLGRVGLLTNLALLGGILISATVMLALIYMPPLAEVFDFVPPRPAQWLVLATYPAILFLAEEGRKWWARRGLRGQSPLRDLAPTGSYSRRQHD